MNVTQIADSSAITLSESDFPELPKAVPAVIENINSLQSKLLMAKTPEAAHKIGQELGDRVRELTGLFTRLHEAAEEVSKVVGPFINKNTGSKKGPWDSEKMAKGARKEALKSLKTLDHVMKHEMEKRIVRPEISVTPDYLPAVQGLSGSLGELSLSLNSLMNEAMNPSKEANIDELKLRLVEHRERFTDLGLQAKALEKPVADKAFALDKFIEETREHAGTIAINNALCDWEIMHIDLFAEVFNKLKLLQDQLAGLSSRTEDLKAWLRNNIYTSSDPVKLSFRSILENPGERTLKAVETEIRALIAEYPETALSEPKENLISLLEKNPETKISEAKGSIRAVLSKLPDSPVDTALRDFAEIVRIYEEAKSKAENYREIAEKAIDDLGRLIDEQEEGLIAKVKELPFHDPEVEIKVLKQMEEAISIMQGERKKMLYKLDEKWSAITNQFTNNLKNCSLYEINRLGYSVFENGGSIPKDSTYGYFWNVAKPYVKPMATKEDSSDK